MNQIFFSKNRFLALDSFRGLCALSVAIFHMNFMDSVTEVVFFRNSSTLVEFFFVLSGFVMSHAYSMKNDLTFKSFFISRTFRIFPLHIFMLILFLLIETLSLVAYRYGVNFRGVPFSGKTGINELIPNLLLLQSWTNYTDNLSFNGPSWSISVEYYMYFIFFITLLTNRYKRYVFCVLVVVVSLVSIYYGLTLATSAATRGLYCFFLGNLTYLVYSKFPKLKINQKLVSVFEVMLILLVVMFVSSSIKHKIILSGGFFSLVVFVFSYEKGFVSCFLRSNALVYLGTLSYSIYLTHYFVILIMKSLSVVIDRIFMVNITYMVNAARYIDFGSSLLNNLAVVALLLLIILVSRLTHQYIEEKGRYCGRLFRQ